MNGKKELKRRDLLYPEMSYQIIGILFEVYNELGYGYQEKYYQRAISARLKEMNFSFKEQIPVKINFQRNEIGTYFLDFIIDNKIAIEIKKGDKFLKTNIDQLYAYLKASGLKLGILVNFTKKGSQFKKIINLDS
jgi:GxxExxY protein